jgi:hypothetical protein
MKNICLLFLGAFCFSTVLAAVSEQNLTCKGIKDSADISLSLTLRGQLEGLMNVNFQKMSDNKVRKFKVPITDASMKVKGFWKPKSEFGEGKFWEADMLGKMYWYQHDNRPTLTVAWEDKAETNITYRFYMNTEQLGKAWKKGRGYLWIDPDYPEGGGHPVDLSCTSEIK